MGGDDVFARFSDRAIKDRVARSAAARVTQYAVDRGIVAIIAPCDINIFKLCEFHESFGNRQIRLVIVFYKLIKTSGQIERSNGGAARTDKFDIQRQIIDRFSFRRFQKSDLCEFRATDERILFDFGDRCGNINFCKSRH